MQPENYAELRRAAKMIADARAILEGIHESMEPSDSRSVDIITAAADATYLEDYLDHLVDVIRED